MRTNPATIFRKFITFLCSIIALLVIGATVYMLVIKPKITVIAPSGTTFGLYRIADNTLITQKTLTNTQMTLTEPAAEYVVQIGTTASGKQQCYISAHDLQNVTCTFGASTQMKATQIEKGTAYNVVARDNTLYYLNTTKRIIEALRPDGTFIALDSSSSVNNFSSDNPGKAQGIHLIANQEAIISSGGELFILRNNQLVPLNTSGIPTAASTLLIASNPTESSFVIAAGHTLYYYASPDVAPTKVTTLGKEVDQLAYGGGKVIAYSMRMPVAQEDIRHAYSNYAIDPIIVDINTGSQATLTAGPIADASISPDGHYATIEGEMLQYTTLYDLASRSPIYNVVNPDVSPYWLDGTHYIYTRGSDVWKMDVIARTATTIAALPTGSLPTSISSDQSNNTYYVTVYNSDTDADIFRISAINESTQSQ